MFDQQTINIILNQFNILFTQNLSIILIAILIILE